MTLWVRWKKLKPNLAIDLETEDLEKEESEEINKVQRADLW